MFVDFVGYLYPRKYIPTNVKQKSELSYTVMQQTNEITSPRTKIFFVNPRTLVPTNKSDIPNILRCRNIRTTFSVET